MGYIAFSGDLDPEVDAAAAELRRSGFKVKRMPKRCRVLLAHPKDDFLEATMVFRDDDENAVECAWTVIDAIAEDYGGKCRECRPIGANHIPFWHVFELIAGSRNAITRER